MLENYSDFLIGASTAAHQVEGNNIHSDFWAMEQMKHSSFDEPSLSAVDHYHHFKEDIDLMADAGLNAYRFSIEWARIEPEKGKFDEKEIEHYREVLKYCHDKGIVPIVTLHHFSSPKWLICSGGWESEDTIDAFKNYCVFVIQKLGDLLEYVCTINEANMGIQLAAIMQEMMEQMDAKIQVGVNLSQENPLEQMMKAAAAENIEVFGTPQPQSFLSMRTKNGDKIIMRAHEAARDAIKEICPEIKVGITLSLFDVQIQPGGEQMAKEEWTNDFTHYLPYIQKDDFFGLQNYTRKIFGPEGALSVPEDAKKTQMGYENYPLALKNVICKVAKEISIPIMVTENGIATEDDKEREAFINNAFYGVMECVKAGIPVIGYLHWSLLDNFEWQKGFSKKFGLIAVDRKTQKRYPKGSLRVLGEMRGEMEKVLFDGMINESDL